MHSKNSPFRFHQWVFLSTVSRPLSPPANFLCRSSPMALSVSLGLFFFLQGSVRSYIHFIWAQVLQVFFVQGSQHSFCFLLLLGTCKSISFVIRRLSNLTHLAQDALFFFTIIYGSRSARVLFITTLYNSRKLVG